MKFAGALAACIILGVALLVAVAVLLFVTTAQYAPTLLRGAPPTALVTLTRRKGEPLQGALQRALGASPTVSDPARPAWLLVLDENARGSLSHFHGVLRRIGPRVQLVTFSDNKGGVRAHAVRGTFVPTLTFLLHAQAPQLSRGLRHVTAARRWPSRIR